MKKLIRSFFGLALLGLCICLGAGPAQAARQMKIGFVYIAPVGDAGWSFSHDQARRSLGRDPDNITVMAENVPENEIAGVIRTMAENGCDIIVTTSYGYLPATVEAAAAYPQITFLHCSGDQTAPNLSVYFGRMYQARYLSGMVAGGMSKSGRLGYVAAFPLPEVIRGINAFTLGAREVKPEAEVRVLWTKNWYDPMLEADAALALIDGGADVIAQHQDSTAAQEAAQERGVWSVGYHSDMSAFAPKAHLAAAVWNWINFYRDVVDKARRGEWKSGDFWLGMDTGAVDISPFGPMVPEELRQRVLERKKDIVSGKYAVFTGPVIDNRGKSRIAPGAQPTDEDLLRMDWFTQGVTASDFTPPEE